MQRRNATFDGLAAFRQVSIAFDIGTNISRETPIYVTGNYFEVLGVRPFLGRLLTAEDDRDQAASAMVLSHDFWAAAYHSDPAILGSTVRLITPNALAAGGIGNEDKAYTIVGIAPQGFYGTDMSVRPPGWIPLHALLPEGRLAARQPPGIAGAERHSDADFTPALRHHIPRARRMCRWRRAATRGLQRRRPSTTQSLGSNMPNRTDPQRKSTVNSCTNRSYA